MWHASGSYHVPPEPRPSLGQTAIPLTTCTGTRGQSPPYVKTGQTSDVQEIDTRTRVPLQNPCARPRGRAAASHVRILSSRCQAPTTEERSRSCRSEKAFTSRQIPAALTSLPFPCKGGERMRIASTSECTKKRAVASSETTAVVVLTEKQNETLWLSRAAAEAAVGLCRVLGWLDFRKTCWRLRAELLVERVIIGCQSFTLMAVAGSLIGSILCFVEGCFFILESFIEHFHASPQGGGIIPLLIDAIDMFLLGSALLTFGVSFYMMFMGSNEMKKRKGKGWPVTKSIFGQFNLKRLPGCMETHSISQTKSGFGHSIVLILQAGVLDKFKNVPLVSGLDLACFAGAVFVSSACVFLLSKLAMHGSKTTCA